MVAQPRPLVSKHGVYLPCGHNDVNHTTQIQYRDYLSRGQSTAEATTNGDYLPRGQTKNGDYLPRGQIQYRGYLSRGQMKSKTKTKVNTILVNEGDLASIGTISSEGDVLANEGATSSSFILARPVYHHLSQPAYQDQNNLPKLNVPTKFNKISTHRKKNTIPTYSSNHNTKLCSFARECENITLCRISCLQDTLYSLPTSFWNFYNFYQISPSFEITNRVLV